MRKFTMQQKLKADKPDRLFVPLASQPYYWFLSGDKKWELRKNQRQYTIKHVYSGRKIEIRRGYSDISSSQFGVIGSVIQRHKLEEIYSLIPWQEVIPTAKSLREATEVSQKILNANSEMEQDGSWPGYIIFEVALDGISNTTKLKIH